MKVTESDLAIVVQGPIEAQTPSALRRYRLLAPRAQVVLSTWTSDERRARALRQEGLLDVLVINDDPGALPPTIRSAAAAPNNFNRMLLSSRAGLQASSRPFVIRVRSDASLDPQRVLQRWNDWARHEQSLLFVSRYTRHPYGIHGYLFHVSDWITAGLKQACLDYWSAPPMSLEDATYFERHPHRSDRPNHRRWRARMSQEQWLTCHWARKLGYRVIDSIEDESPLLRNEYLRYLRNECIIVDADSLGMRIDSEAHSRSTWFLRADCFSEYDWIGLVRRDRWRWDWRWILFAARNVILRAVLAKKFVINMLTRGKTCSIS
ncbi:MAG: WavE lipopolysaccharide synthesis family protein [Rhodocyclaceae bacterium]|nr:WavE lipopolysaccharide synthesis family protein [Rhodocyclaceae bacterium]